MPYRSCSRSCITLLLGTILSGCGGLHEMTEGPTAQSFHPKSIAVLPPITGEYDGARDDALDVLTSALGKLTKFETVVPPEQMLDVVQNQKQAFDALVQFNSRLENTGQPDRESAAALADALGVDALLVVRVNSWEHVRTEGDNAARIGFGLRLVDPASGAIVWKARHERAKSYTFMKPALKDVAADLAQEMVEYLPN